MLGLESSRIDHRLQAYVSLVGADWPGVMVGFNRRFAPFVREVAEVLAFMEAVRGGKSLPTPFEACVDSTAATLATMDSLAMGLPLVHDGTSWLVRAALLEVIQP